MDNLSARAYDEQLAERVRRFLAGRGAAEKDTEMTAAAMLGKGK
jgi:hypothetical protein